MKNIYARQALLPDGWATDVTVEIDSEGRIMAVKSGQGAAASHSAGALLPAPVNAHSHAFQRAMAGLTEHRGANPSDSFWTWRQLMYRFLDQLTPDHVEAIAGLVQMEMLEAGYGASVEFHYLHHQPDGAHYDNIAEMAERVAAAASLSGMGLTLLPVHYQYGGCDKRPLGEGQIRFGTDMDAYSKLFEVSKTALSRLPSDRNSGVAPHSLRAVGQESFSHLKVLAESSPIHLHLAEQIAEVEEVEASWGKRPVEWALDNLPLNGQWCMIHCTQMLPHETENLAKSGAVAGLCPITESNLGDGIFDGLRWFEQGGQIAIGSDSNVRISLSEELRTLDYSQRLRDHSRAALATNTRSTGRRLFDAASSGGAKIAGRRTGRIEAGYWADLMTLDDDHIDLEGKQGDFLLDAYIFSGDDAMVRDVWSAGRHMVTDGKHVHREKIAAKYRAAMRDLKAAI